MKSARKALFVALSAIILCSCGAHENIAETIAQARALIQNRKPDQALSLLSRAVDRTGFTSAVEADRARLLCCLGEACLKARRSEQAEGAYREALAIAERKYGPGCLQSTDALCGLANVAAARGDYRQAEVLARQALSILSQRDAADDARLEPVVATVLGVACRSGRCRDEIDLNLRLVALRTKIYGANSAYTCAARQMLAEAFLHHRQWQDAIEQYRLNVQAARTDSGVNLCSAAANLAHALELANQHQAALMAVKEAMAAEIRHPNPLLPEQTLSLLRLQAQIYDGMHDFEDALSTYRLLLLRARKTKAVASTQLADIYVNIAEACRKLGRNAEAAAAQQQAERLYKAHLR